MFLALQNWTRTSCAAKQITKEVKNFLPSCRDFLKARHDHTLFSFQRSGEALYGLLGADKSTRSMVYPIINWFRWGCCCSSPLGGVTYGSLMVASSACFPVREAFLLAPRGCFLSHRTGSEVQFFCF